MNKLIELNFIQKKNTFDNKNVKKIKSLIEETSENHVYDKFKEKFFSSDELYNIDKKDKSQKFLCSIIKRVFTLENKTGIINLVNSIYDDGWDINNTALNIRDDFKASNKIEIAYDLAMVLQNEYKQVQYKIVLKVKDYDNLAIIVYRELNSSSIDNVLSFFKNNGDKLENKELYKNKNNPYILMLNSNMLVPDVLELTLNNQDTTFFYKFNVLKGWKYDFKAMYETNLYLLFPLKVFDLGKRVSNMMYDFVDDEMINFEIIRFFKEMNKYLKKLEKDSFISESAIFVTNTICFEILSNMYESIDLLEVSKHVLNEIV